MELCSSCNGYGGYTDPIGGSDHIVCHRCAGSRYLLDQNLTPEDIYSMTSQKIHHNIHILCGCYYNHLEDTGIDPFEIEHQYDLTSERIAIHEIKNFNFDSRRYWRLATVWFDNSPVMIIQNAGREGDDHAERFITNKQKFLDMAQHIKSLLPIKPKDDITDIVEPTQVLGRKLICFYGNSLDGYFEYYR